MYVARFFHLISATAENENKVETKEREEFSHKVVETKVLKSVREFVVFLYMTNYYRNNVNYTRTIVARRKKKWVRKVGEEAPSK